VRYRDCAYCSPPHKTLAALAPSGIVIQLTNARERPPYGPRGSWPPPRLRASQVHGGFEGEPPSEHIGVIQLVVRGRDGIDHSLFVWLGRTHPTAHQLARASTGLRTAAPEPRASLGKAPEARMRRRVRNGGSIPARRAR
jgi:hypothetical protein